MRLRMLVAVACLGVFLLAAFGACMAGGGHNQGMYLAASVKIAAGEQLYRDFGFTQTPYLPHLYAAIFHLTGFSHLLLKAKLIAYLMYLGSAAMIYFASLKVSRSPVLACCLLAVFSIDSSILAIVSECSNYIYAVAGSVGALWLFILARESRDRRGLCYSPRGWWRRSARA